MENDEEALGPKHKLIVHTVHNLSLFYSDQGKLEENMYEKALQGYEEAVGLDLVSTYIPTLNSMSNIANLYSQTDRRDMAKNVYLRASSAPGPGPVLSIGTCTLSHRNEGFFPLRARRLVDESSLMQREGSENYNSW